MRDRLVDDWLSRINERGYQAAFGQILLAQGFEVLRIGHSPYEHGKDVLAIAPTGEVHCFQLKGGNVGLNDLEMEQLATLVETRPEHPRLPSNFEYRVTLVTNGIISDPALARKSHTPSA
jgi:hypothetical protein